ALAELSPATSLSRLAEHVGMPASKVHRYLQALIASGFAEQDVTTNHYGLGPAALFVGLAALGRLDVVKLATPYLAELRDELNETCFLAVWATAARPWCMSSRRCVRSLWSPRWARYCRCWARPPDWCSTPSSPMPRQPI